MGQALWSVLLSFNIPEVRLNSGQGDVVYVIALGKSIVVLNSEQDAIDLLEKKSAIYSDRPPFITCDMYVTISDVVE